VARYLLEATPETLLTRCICASSNVLRCPHLQLTCLGRVRRVLAANGTQHWQRVLEVGSGGMSEALYMLYSLTTAQEHAGAHCAGSELQAGEQVAHRRVRRQRMAAAEAAWSLWQRLGGLLQPGRIRLAALAAPGSTGEYWQH
jgi:hypothetical protein